MSHDRMAREFVERMAYESIGNAIQPHIPTCNGMTAQSDTLTSSVAHRRRPRSTGDVDDHACYGNHSDIDKEYDSDMISHVRRKISNNFQHYSNLLQGLALPMLFRESRVRRESERDNEDLLDGFEFVESIELHDMEGFIFDSEREIGQGHNFLPVQLQAPTWCDKCGDFIWGVYKQCLTCSSKYTVHLSRSTSLKLFV
ncbi:hypothetical protein NP493_885g00006 [Ridgeia piscesae]|uniref:Phorbol-ester/DAG-type domain-containing protein n=1 Tax=Ridgeia piscesae TaxID=27915 RepID=A0AAD9NKE3_RIDPI|nr:hypothetical protein NP493_885g00006 [Ridgeia piscesae]